MERKAGWMLASDLTGECVLNLREAAGQIGVEQGVGSLSRFPELLAQRYAYRDNRIREDKDIIGVLSVRRAGEGGAMRQVAVVAADLNWQQSELIRFLLLHEPWPRDHGGLKQFLAELHVFTGLPFNPVQVNKDPSRFPSQEDISWLQVELHKKYGLV